MKVQNDPIKSIDDQIRKKIDAKENELENISKMYEKKVEEANARGDDKYVESLDRNNKRIILANKEYEEKLKSYQESLSQVKNNIELDETKAIEVSQDKRNNLKTQAEEKYSKIYNNARENQESLFQKSQNDARQLDQSSRHEKVANESRAQQEIASFASELTQNTREKEENLRKQLESETSAMTQVLVQNKIDTQARLADATTKSQRIENDQKRVQDDQIKFLDQYQANLLKQKQEDFQIRYQQLSAQHQEILDALKAKLNKTTQEAIEANAKEKQAIKDMGDDPFYQLEILKPQLSEDSKNYYIHLEVPPREKEDVHLMAHGREIRITMSKKYTSSLEAEDGSLNRTAKTQLYSKEFSTKDILNAKQISQKYENGVLSFKVAKL